MSISLPPSLSVSLSLSLSLSLSNTVCVYACVYKHAHVRVPYPCMDVRTIYNKASVLCVFVWLCVHTIYRTDLVGGLASLMEAFLLAPAALVILDSFLATIEEAGGGGIPRRSSVFERYCV
jgi:hypothetical protein